MEHVTAGSDGIVALLLAFIAEDGDGIVSFVTSRPSILLPLLESITSMLHLWP